MAVASEHGHDLRLLARAGAAMRAAQRSGGAAHAVFDPQIEADHQDELAIARDLKAALTNKQLELFFQPRIDARRLEVSAVEALLRWRHPSMGLVSPARFMPVAERFGLVEPLGEWVLDEVLRKAAAWRSAGLDLQVVVNVSGAQFRRDDFAVKLARALKTHRAPAASVVCELAEVDALENTAATRRAFARLAKLGVRIAVGEFSGQPDGLSALQALAVHEVSVARHLVAALPTDGEARRTVERIVAAAHARGMRVGGVGIETEAHRDQVVHLGCDVLQGFLFAKPMSARGVAIWSVDASRNLGQTLKPSQFKETMVYEGQPTQVAFAPTRITPRR
jgi:EAL domain-containing protein (putative c-di-GMP-specific phosphodiesterase class I)